MTLGHFVPLPRVSTFSLRRRLGALALILVGVVTAACGDGPLRLSSAAGYYRLVSVNRQALPFISPPSLGLPTAVIRRGDLVLRGDGSFMQGIGLWGTGDGTYRVSGQEVVFHWQGGSEVVGNLAGDSISIHFDAGLQSLHLVFRRASLSPSSFASERYRLTSFNGRTGVPLIMYDTVIGGTRYVGRVPFDSLTFLDGVFFRQHRAEEQRAYLASGDSLIADDEWAVWGVFESGPGWIRLMRYSPPGPPSDSLSIVGDTLIRRTALITGVQEERYTSR